MANPAFLPEPTIPPISVAAPPSAPTGTRILVVDDNAQVRRATATALSRLGFHVMTAEDGAPAIKLAETTPPDLALVDFDMPTPGLVVVRRLKELYGPAVWVAVLSGDDGPKMRSQCFDAGADDVVAKPARMAELHRRMIAAARLQQAFVEQRLGRERTDRLLAYGAEAAAMLAHDLNNGLAVALCNMSFLESVTTGLDADHAQAFSATRTALRRMSGLVANFVDVARFEDAAVKPQATIGNVRTLLEEVVEVHAVGARVRITIECEPALTGCFDAVLIERVLHNLIGNAVRYCRTDGEIRVTGRQLDPTETHSVELAVFNNGPLVAPELETNLFAKYARGTHGQRGFGLYFCRLACEAHNGRIVYRGQSDGPSFLVQLPGRS